MSPGTPVDKNPFEGLSSAPQITLDPRFNASDDDCKAYPGWNDAWTRVFQRLGWTGSAPPRVALTHIFSCVRGLGLITDLGNGSSQAEHYFALSDLIYLLQSDLVFELNGKPVRAWGSIYLTHHETLALENTVNEQLGEFIPRNIQDFLTDVALGNGPDTRPIPSGTQSSSGGAAQGPGTINDLSDVLGVIVRGPGAPGLRAPNSQGCLEVCAPSAVVESQSWANPPTARTEALKEAIRGFISTHTFDGNQS